MKLKQESSGIPSRCFGALGNVDDVLLDEYVNDYFQHEGISLCKENISYNAAKRTIMKQLLNSLWGKLAQNENNTVVSFVNGFDDLLSMANDNSIDLTSFDFKRACCQDNV